MMIMIEYKNIEGDAMRISRSIATGSTVATFFIVGITGVLLFFHLDFGGVEFVHEWVGMAMIVACVLHIVVNFASFKKFFRGKSLFMIIICLLLGAFAILMMQENPKQELFEHFKNAKLSKTMEYLGTNEQKFAEFLAQQDKQIDVQTMSLKDVVKQTNIDTLELIGALMEK